MKIDEHVLFLKMVCVLYLGNFPNAQIIQKEIVASFPSGNNFKLQYRSGDQALWLEWPFEPSACCRRID